MGALQRARVINVLLSASLVGVLVTNFVLLQMMFRVAPWSLLGIVLILFLGLLLGSIVGLLRMRPWGYWLAYALVPVSTILHGISLVPFVVELLPRLEWRIWAVFLLNGAFFVGILRSHWLYRRGPPGGGAPDGMMAHPA
jgi:hypothetical protein